MTLQRRTLMTLALVARMLNDWSDGAFDANGEIDVAFIGTVFAGDTITVSGMVEEIIPRDGQSVARCMIACHAGERAVLAGTAHLPLPGQKDH